MKKIEITLVLLILIGIVLKMFSVEGSGTLITFSFLTLSFLYLLLGFVILNDIPLKAIFRVSSYSTIGWQKITWSVIAGILLSMAALSLIYPILSWDGGLIVVELFNLLLLPIFITSIIIYATNRSRLQENILLRSGMVICVAVIEVMLMRYGILMIR